MQYKAEEWNLNVGRKVPQMEGSVIEVKDKGERSSQLSLR